MKLYRGDDGSPLRFPAFFTNTRSSAAQYASFHRDGRVRVFDFKPRRTLVLRREPENYQSIFESAYDRDYDSIHWLDFEIAYDQWVVLDPDSLIEERSD